MDRSRPVELRELRPGTAGVKGDPCLLSGAPVPVGCAWNAVLTGRQVPETLSINIP